MKEMFLSYGVEIAAFLLLSLFYALAQWYQAKRKADGKDVTQPVTLITQLASYAVVSAEAWAMGKLKVEDKKVTGDEKFRHAVKWLLAASKAAGLKEKNVELFEGAVQAAWLAMENGKSAPKKR